MNSFHLLRLGVLDLDLLLIGVRDLDLLAKLKEQINQRIITIEYVN
jgi:hypothetical protein